MRKQTNFDFFYINEQKQKTPFFKGVCAVCLGKLLIKMPERLLFN